MQYTLLNYKPFLTFHRIIQQRRKYIMESRIKSKRLNYSELFSITTEIYKKNIKTIAFVSIFIIIPLFLFTQWVQSKYVTNLNYLYNNMVDIDMTAEMDALSSISLYNVISLLVQIVVQPLANIAIIWGTVNIIKEQKNTIKGNFLYAFIKAPHSIWTNFLQIVFLFVVFLFSLVTIITCFTIPSKSIAIMFLSIVFIICLIIVAYFTTIWTFSDHVVTIQDIGGIKALVASKKVVQNRFRETFLYILFFGVLSFCLNLSVDKILDNIYYNGSYSTYIFCYAVWNFIIFITINGFYIVFMTVLFLNRIWGPTENITICSNHNKIINTSKSENESEKQNKINLEKTPKIEQQNTIDLEKTTEQQQQIEQKYENDNEK